MITKKIIMISIIVIFIQNISAVGFKMTPEACIYALNENSYITDSNKPLSDPVNVAPDSIFDPSNNPWNKNIQTGVFLKITNSKTVDNVKENGIDSCPFSSLENPCYFPPPSYTYKSFQEAQPYTNNKCTDGINDPEDQYCSTMVKTPLIDLTGISERWLHIYCRYNVADFKIYPDIYYIFAAKSELGGGIYGTHDFGLDAQGAFTNLLKPILSAPYTNDPDPNKKDPITIYTENFQNVDARAPYYVDNQNNFGINSYDKIFPPGTLGFVSNTRPIFKGRVLISNSLPSGIIHSYTYFWENGKKELAPGIINYFYLKTNNQIMIKPTVEKVIFEQIRDGNVIKTYDSLTKKERFLIQPNDQIKATYSLKNKFGSEINDIYFRHGIYADSYHTGGVGNTLTSFLCKYDVNKNLVSTYYPFCVDSGKTVAIEPVTLDFAPAEDIVIKSDPFTIPNKEFYYAALASYADVYYDSEKISSFYNFIGYDDKKYLGFKEYDPRIDFDKANSIAILNLNVKLFNPSYNPNQEVAIIPLDYILKVYMYEKGRTSYNEDDKIKEIILDESQLTKNNAVVFIPGYGAGLEQCNDDAYKQQCALDYSKFSYQFSVPLSTTRFNPSEYEVATVSVRHNDPEKKEIGNIQVKPIINPGEIVYFTKNPDGVTYDKDIEISSTKPEDYLTFTVFNPSLERRTVKITIKKFNENNLDNDINIIIFRGNKPLSKLIDPQSSDIEYYYGEQFKIFETKTFILNTKGKYTTWPSSTISKDFIMYVELLPPLDLLSFKPTFTSNPTLNLKVIGENGGGENGGGGGCSNRNDFIAGLSYNEVNQKLDFTYWRTFVDSSLYNEPYDIVFKLYEQEVTVEGTIKKTPIRQYIEKDIKTPTETGLITKSWSVDNLGEGKTYIAEAEVNPRDPNSGTRRITESCEQGSNLDSTIFDISPTDSSKSCSDNNDVVSCHAVTNRCAWDADGSDYPNNYIDTNNPNKLYGYDRVNVDNKKYCVDCNTKNYCNDYKNYEACEQNSCGVIENKQLCPTGSTCSCAWDKDYDNPLKYKCKQLVNRCLYKNPVDDKKCDESNTWEITAIVDVEATKDYWINRLGMNVNDATDDKINNECKPIKAYGACAKLSYFNIYNFLIAVLLIIAFYFILFKIKKFLSFTKF